jgi:hypothetical protein
VSELSGHRHEIIHTIPNFKCQIHYIPRLHTITIYRQKIHCLYGRYGCVTATVILCRITVTLYFILHTLFPIYYVTCCTLQGCTPFPLLILIWKNLYVIAYSEAVIFEHELLTKSTKKYGQKMIKKEER